MCRGVKYRPTQRIAFGIGLGVWRVARAVPVATMIIEGACVALVALLLAAIMRDAYSGK